MLVSFVKNLMNKFSGNKDKKILAEVLTDSRAVFSSFGNNIYASDFVNSCIERIANEISKIEVVSVISKENSISRLNDDITRLFRDGVNELQTAKDFLSCCEWLRRKDKNCFIYPQYDIVKSATGNEFKRYTAFYPLAPVSAELGHFDNGEWAIKFQWRDGSNDILPYNSIIHLRWRRGTSTLMGGGNDYGASDDSDTLKALKNLDEILQGLPKMIQSSLSLQGVLSVKTMLDRESITQAGADFEDRIKVSKSGIVAVGLDGEYTPINKAMPAIPDGVLKFLKDIIRERYGISQAILDGDFTGTQHAAFFQNCLEDFIVEFEQAFTNRLFSQREKDVGHRVKCYYSRVSYMDAAEKQQLAILARDTGLMTLNEIRELYGLSPLDEGGNVRLQSLNYINANIANAYQLQDKQQAKAEGEKNETD